MSTSYRFVRPRRRSRNTARAVRRGSGGRFVRTGGRSVAVLKPEARAKGKYKYRGGKRKAKSKTSVKRNRRSRRNRGGLTRRRNRGGLTRRRNRRRSRRSNRGGLRRRNRGRGRRRNRSRGRRRNRSHGLRRRNRRHGRRRNRSHGFRRRRNRGFMRRRNPGSSLMGTFRDIFRFGTAKDVVAGTVGLSVSLWGPKLLGFKVWAPLGRGYGGGATSIASAGLVSWLVGKVSPSAGRSVLAGGLLGSFAGLLSAVVCGFRQQALPFETGLLACALPTMPGPSAIPGSPAAMALAGGMPMSAVVAARLPGLSGYGGGNYAGVNNLLSNEQAYRSSAGGMNDYVAQLQAGAQGMRDYVSGQGGLSDFAAFSSPGSSKSMDDSPETF